MSLIWGRDVHAQPRLDLKPTRRTTTQARRVWTHLPKGRGSGTDTGRLEDEGVEE